jgi:hypothetical protein
MTRDQIKFYLLHPRQWLRWKFQQLEAWRMKRKARKAARLFITEVRQMEANLKASAYPGCGKCHGQGNRGWNLTTKTFVVCSCTMNPNTQSNLDAHPWLKETKS